MSSPLSFSQGLPDSEFFMKAWSSEPLTGVLKDTNIPFVLPLPELDVSLIAKKNNAVIGQCSANKITKYWTHLETLNLDDQNLSTRIFASIHKKAVSAEKKYLEQIGQSEEKSLHNAGIAVLPENRGCQLGLQMTLRQIELCKEHKLTTLFCETTNRYSAAIMEQLNFTQVVKYPYKTLAVELGCPDLAQLDDSFTVWCLSV